MSEVAADTQVSVEQDGRVLTGIGPTSEALTAHMDRRTPDNEPTASGAATEGQATPPASGTVAAPAEPPQTRGQKRFSELTHERDTARAETTTERTQRLAAEQRVTELEAKLAQASTPQQAAQASAQLTQAETQAQAAGSTQPATTAQKFTFPAYEAALEQYPDLTYDQWQDAKLEAFGAWKDQQFDARMQARFDGERTQRTLNDQAQSVWTKGAAVYKDFEHLRATGPGARINLGKTDAETMERNAYVLRHPRAEHIAHAIFKDGDFARKLQAASALEFGSLIADIAPPAPSSQPTAISPPPAPYSPVGTGSSTVATPSSDLAKTGYDFDRSGYREKRAAERGLRRAR